MKSNRNNQEKGQRNWLKAVVFVVAAAAVFVVGGGGSISILTRLAARNWIFELLPH